MDTTTIITDTAADDLNLADSAILETVVAVKAKGKGRPKPAVGGKPKTATAKPIVVETSNAATPKPKKARKAKGASSSQENSNASQLEFLLPDLQNEGRDVISRYIEYGEAVAALKYDIKETKAEMDQENQHQLNTIKPMLYKVLPYIKGVRDDVEEVKRLVKVSNFEGSPRYKLPEDRTRTLLYMMIPRPENSKDELRKRYNEWGAAIDIAIKEDWDGDQFQKQFGSNGFKKFIKTHRPPPKPIYDFNKKARRVRVVFPAIMDQELVDEIVLIIPTGWDKDKFMGMINVIQYDAS